MYWFSGLKSAERSAAQPMHCSIERTMSAAKRSEAQRRAVQSLRDQERSTAQRSMDSYTYIDCFCFIAACGMLASGARSQKIHFPTQESSAALYATGKKNRTAQHSAAQRRVANRNSMKYFRTTQRKVAAVIMVLRGGSRAKRSAAQRKRSCLGSQERLRSAFGQGHHNATQRSAAPLSRNVADKHSGIKKMILNLN